MDVQELTSNSAAAAAFLKAISNQNRLRILCELTTGERSVSELEAHLPLSQSALSQHLAKLREAKLVTTRRDAQSIYYSLADARVVRLMGVLHEMFCAPEKKAPKGVAK
jgi:DNA-binding transcriptional ArsR family regulator